MKSLILIINFMSLLISVHAQDFTVKGRVIDINKNSIIGANIQCFEYDSIFVNGSISDEKGYFSIQLSHEGDYKLKISYIGYETNYLFLRNIQNDINIGSIILANSSINLNEVAITAQQMVRTANKLTVFPSKQQLQHSVGGYEVLAHLLIPTLDIDPFKKSISMKEGTVIVCINGRQATDEEINNINSGTKYQSLISLH